MCRGDGVHFCIELGEVSPPSSRYKEELGVIAGAEEGVGGIIHGDGTRLADSGEGTYRTGDGDSLHGEGVMDGAEALSIGDDGDGDGSSCGS